MKVSHLLALIILFFTKSHFAGFMLGELVHSGSSKCEIQYLKIDDQVTSFDGEKLVNDKVIKNQVVSKNIGIKIIFKNASLVVSPEQLLYLPEVNSWVAAKNLKPDDQVLSITGDLIPVIDTEQLEKVMQFHTLTIQDQHNFFVSKLGILVHNEPVSLIFLGTVAAEVIADYAIGTIVTGIIGYLGYQELFNSKPTSNSPFPVISLNDSTQELDHLQRMELQKQQQKVIQKNAAQQKQDALVKKAKERSVQQETELAKERASVLHSHVKMQQAKAASVKTKEQTAARLVSKNEAVVEAGEAAKKADSEKPVDEEEAKKADETEKKEGLGSEVKGEGSGSSELEEPKTPKDCKESLSNLGERKDEKGSSDYRDITEPGSSRPNIETDANADQFKKNLEEGGVEQNF